MRAGNDNSWGPSTAASDIGPGTRYFLYCWLAPEAWGILSVFGAPIPDGVVPRQRVVASVPDPAAIVLSERADARLGQAPYRVVD